MARSPPFARAWMTARSTTSSKSRPARRPTRSTSGPSGQRGAAAGARRWRYRAAPCSLRELVLAAGAGQAVPVTWRQGSRGSMSSRFVALRVRPANVALRRAAANAQTELPARWLLPEWPADAEEPSDYWLASLPADTPLAELVRLGKLRWRIEHDYRELKDALGLDHFEGRTHRGWHHHVTLVSVAHAFLTLERRRPRLRAAA